MIETPVLISGGGAVGVTLAMALSRRGVASILAGDATQLPDAIPADLAPFAPNLAASDPGITLRLGWRLFGFERFASHVTSHLVEIGGERQQQVRAAFLLGCDGAGSLVRNFLDIDLVDAGGRNTATAPGRGRVLLAGEARRVFGPASREGLQSGVADALALAELIAADLSAPSGEDLLPRYEALRRLGSGLIWPSS